MTHAGYYEGLPMLYSGLGHGMPKWADYRSGPCNGDQINTIRLSSPHLSVLVSTSAGRVDINCRLVGRILFTVAGEAIDVSASTTG